MSRTGEPPVEGQAKKPDAPGKSRRRRRKGKRDRWPYASGGGVPQRGPGDPAAAKAPDKSPAKDASRRDDGQKNAGRDRSRRLKGGRPRPVAGDAPNRPDTRVEPRRPEPSRPELVRAEVAAVAESARPEPVRLDAPRETYRGDGHGRRDPNRPHPHGNARPAPHGGQPVRRPRPSGPLYAALDLGTNNCRLLIAEPSSQGFRVVDAFSRIVRLGEGLSQSGRLSEAAQVRAIEALKVCASKLAGWGVERMKLVATEACRAAANGEAFLDRVAAEAGLSLEIVTRESEARLAVAGCANLIDWRDDGAILFDIGGGSSELVWLDLKRERRHSDITRHIRAWTSLPVGVVTLSERHGGVHVDGDIFEDMVEEVAGMIDAFAEVGPLCDMVSRGHVHLIGTSGTVTTLAGIYHGLIRYDRRRVDGTWLDREDVDDLMDHLVGMGYDDRVAHPCIGQDRADLVLAGCAILEAIRRRWPCARLRVADRGLREGILTELMAADGIWSVEGGRR